MPGQAVNDAAPGWYGKLAMLGDFASRRLPPAFIATCDEWLSRGMAASRGQLGERWLDIYLTGPIWRFAWAPPLVDDQWWFGIMMPSVDNVGRYFPLLVARPSATAPESAQGVAALDAWYEHLGWAALNTLRADARVDDFEAALAGAPSPWVEAAAARRPESRQLAGRERHTLDGPASLDQWIEGLALREAMQRCAGRSFWWPDHARMPDNSFSVAPGLPGADDFSLLLQGQW